MSFANRHNKTTSNLFSYKQIPDAPYYKCREMFDKGFTEENKNPVRVLGCYISNAGRYAPNATLICDGFNVNLPKHMVNDVQDILSNEEDIQDINAGVVGVYFYEYVNKNGGKSYSARWCDMNAGNADLPY